MNLIYYKPVTENNFVLITYQTDTSVLNTLSNNFLQELN